jgi:hypothetical protein
MRVIRVASALSLFASVLAAQQTAPAAASPSGKLQAEVHFTTDGSTWFTTNMPAYVAMFDVSRTGVTQLYPTFSAQASVPAGTFRDVALRFPAALPPTAAQPAALTPVSVAGTTGGNYGWPHTLLLVASTAPLRVGNPTQSNITMNNTLLRQHHLTDVETPEGIKAIVAMVSPMDSYADVVTDQISSLPGSVRALASAGTYDPNRTSVGYMCTDANHTFYSVVSQLGSSCSALRVMPPGGANAGSDPNIPLTAPGPVVQTKVVAADSVKAAVKRSPGAETQNISDPADIKRFMESLRNGNARETSAGTAHASDVHATDANRRNMNANNGGAANSRWAAQNGAQSSKPISSPTPTSAMSSPRTIAAPPPNPPASGSSESSKKPID